MLLKEFIMLVLENEVDNDKTNPGKVAGGRAVAHTKKKILNTDIELKRLIEDAIEFIRDKAIWTNKDLRAGKINSSVLNKILKIYNNLEEGESKNNLGKAYQEVNQLYKKGIEEVGNTTTQSDVAEAYRDFVWFENEEEYKKMTNLLNVLQNL